MFTHNRFNTNLVLIFSDLNKAEIYKLPHRDRPHHEIEILMSFNYLNLLKPIEQTKIITLENQTIKPFRSKLNIENNFLWEKNQLVLKQMIKQ